MNEEESLEETTIRTAIESYLSARFALREHAGRTQIFGSGEDGLEAGRAFLAEIGNWVVANWPEEWGGQGLSPAENAVVQKAISRYDTPDLYPWIVGMGLVAPVLLEHGSKDQLERWLPGIRSGEEIWCLLFSEPDAGSDLASMSTRATRDGSRWIIHGQKLWSSRAHYAKWGLLLAVTDPTKERRASISAFGINMQQPGVDVRPLRQMNGDTHFNEVFFDGAIIDDVDRIDDEGEGWAVAMTTLKFERESIGDASVSLRTEDVVEAVVASGRLSDPVVRQRLAQVVARIEIARLNRLRAREASLTGVSLLTDGPGDKMWHALTTKMATELVIDVSGPAGQLSDHAWNAPFLTGPSMSIRGGTDEILKNTLARKLGLPSEPRVSY